MYKNILYSIDGSIARLTLNRPEVFNSLNIDVCLELIDAFGKIEKDETIKVVILTGAGKGFCSGQDLKVLTEMDKITPSEVMEKSYNPMIKAMRHLPKPIIAQLNGVAAGAGCSLALACDMIIASQDAIMTEAFIGIGLVPDSGSSYFLPRMVGSLKAFELAAMGMKISAEEALKYGMVNKVVPAENLEKVVEEVAQYFVHAPSKSIAMIKAMLNQSSGSTLDEMLNIESKYQDLAANTADFREGINAFKEKRKPRYKGI